MKLLNAYFVFNPNPVLFSIKQLIIIIYYFTYVKTVIIIINKIKINESKYI